MGFKAVGRLYHDLIVITEDGKTHIIEGTYAVCGQEPTLDLEHALADANHLLIEKINGQNEVKITAIVDDVYRFERL